LPSFLSVLYPLLLSGGLGAEPPVVGVMVVREVLPLEIF